MMDNKVKAEEVFGVVSDFHGAWANGEKKQEFSVQIEGRTPHWHDSCFDGTEVKQEKSVPEKELSSHF